MPDKQTTDLAIGILAYFPPANDLITIRGSKNTSQMRSTVCLVRRNVLSYLVLISFCGARKKRACLSHQLFPMPDGHSFDIPEPRFPAIEPYPYWKGCIHSKSSFEGPRRSTTACCRCLRRIHICRGFFILFKHIDRSGFFPCVTPAYP